MSYCFCIVVFLLLLTAELTLAGPPLLADDTDTPGDKHWEINAAFTIEKRQTELTYEAPILDINYGIGVI
jgi:hypothetical protein